MLAYLTFKVQTAEEDGQEYLYVNGETSYIDSMLNWIPGVGRTGSGGWAIPIKYDTPKLRADLETVTRIMSEHCL